jgi:hydrogenase maturation protein HypF
MWVESTVSKSEIHKTSSLSPSADFNSESVIHHKTQRIGIDIQGIVQSVGFRPFVFAVANRHKLNGFVTNKSGSVYIEVEGSQGAIDLFLRDLKSEPPPLSRITLFEARDLAPRGDRSFQIKASVQSFNSAIFISPDVATCADCLRELHDPNDRRYGYPFLNCVNCGPRLTIIERAPYDRAHTTMKNFALCRECRDEYENPSDRRFHAQPVACPACGPMLRCLPDLSDDLLNAPLGDAAKVILAGGIVALKSLGGYHLACDAKKPAAVALLRQRKGREDKPLAIMVKDSSAAQRLAYFGNEELTELESHQRPIVIVRSRKHELAQEVSGQSPDIGIMLPYTPLHSLLMEEVGDRALVMTSGNESEHPIAWDDQDALKRLRGIADLILTHNRPIRVRCDDSVIKFAHDEPSLRIPIRRSRGFAPGALNLPMTSPSQILAFGGQMKNTFALARNDHAFLSHHVGELDHLPTLEAYQKEIDLYEKLFAIVPEVLACDLHPDYLSTRLAQVRARKEGLRLIPVQHHHAHMASCMADNGLIGPVIGVTFDGTGFGNDGQIWGGEFLTGSYESFNRAAHFNYVQMPGGEQAVLEPWRMALSHALQSGIEFQSIAKWFPTVPKEALETAHRMIGQNFNCPLTSSAGRLFDTVAAIIGLREKVSYDGQAAIELEWLAGHSPSDGIYPIQIIEGDISSPLVLGTSELISGIANDYRLGLDPAAISRRFHSSMSDISVRVCEKIRERENLNRVVLSGGVFMNGRLLSELKRNLDRRNFDVYCHRSVPANDGGLSLGQLAVAAAVLREEKLKCA